MLRTIMGWMGATLAGIACLQAAQPQQAASPASASAAQYKAVLNRYCITCHNEKLKTAGLMLDKMDVANVPAGAEVWEKVIRKLRGGAMPPPRLPRPDKATNDAFATYLETSIDRAATAKPNPGRPAVHRLNRAEYANAVRDLLGLEINVEPLLPADDTGYGFDNIGDVLSVSPTLLESYLTAARKISRLAVGDPVLMRPVDETFDTPIDLIQGDRMSEDLPFGSRGGMAIRYNFPADGDYIVKVRLARNGDRANGDYGTVVGINKKRQLDVVLDDASLKLFTIGGMQFGKGQSREQEEYTQHGADANLEVRFPAKAGPHMVGVSFREEEVFLEEGVLHAKGAFRNARTGEPSVETVTIRGPFDAKGLGESPSRHKIFVCHPPAGTASGSPVKPVSLKDTTDETACANRILSTLARRAYRRPITDADLKPLIGFYKTGLEKGGFEVGIRLAVQRILSGPEFLFRVEEDPANAAPGTVFRISDLELASRLSFFLWSSIPDDQLLSIAEQGRLKDPVVLEQQVRRMLHDPRSKAFTSNFFGQWLQLRQVPQLAPDPVEFPDWDENLRMAFQQETDLFLQSMVRENHPLMELLDANYTYLNERLADHYGIPNVYGSHFRRVMLTDENRRGLLGQGSVLSLTSYPTRTSVVLRGVWLLENILATPPPAPPPNVPALKDRGEDGRIKSVRESMEAHRANPVCASCHLRMDPLGFALENFNGIGKWRTTEGSAGTKIDNSGELPDGTKFQGPVELRKMLLSKRDQFAATVIEKLLTYSMGRGAEYFDEPVVRKIRREAGPDFRWSSLILGVVKSEPFQMRRTREL